MTQDGSSVGRIVFANDLDGAQCRTGRMRERRVAHRTESVPVGIEATGVYG